MKNDGNIKKYSISEFAKACGTTKDTLYHYEKQGLLVPSMEECNHYRHYSSGDFHRFQYIAHLRRLGFSVSEIRECLSSHKVQTYLELLEQSRQQCLKEIEDCQHRYSIITSALESTSRYSGIPVETPGIRYSDEEFFFESPFSGNFHSLEGISQFQKHLTIAESIPDVTTNITVFQISQNGVRKGLPPKYHLMIQISDPASVDHPDSLHRKPAGSYLQMFFQTDIFTENEENLNEMLQTMLSYAEEHNYRITTDFYAFLRISTFLTDDPKEYLTEFLIGIE